MSIYNLCYVFNYFVCYWNPQIRNALTWCGRPVPELVSILLVCIGYLKLDQAPVLCLLYRIAFTYSRQLPHTMCVIKQQNLCLMLACMLINNCQKQHITLNQCSFLSTFEFFWDTDRSAPEEQHQASCSSACLCIVQPVKRYKTKSNISNQYQIWKWHISSFFSFS